MGAYVMPLMSYENTCMGAMILSGADKIPHSVYESLVRERVDAAVSVSNTNSGDGASAAMEVSETVGKMSGTISSDKQIRKVYREEPEEGLASTLVAAG